MGAYLVRRFLLMALTLFGMSVLIFVMLRLVPGNIADILVDAAGIAARGGELCGHRRHGHQGRPLRIGLRLQGDGAAGRLDGFWEFGLAPWDMAAGSLLITEAGGLVGTLDGADYRQNGNIVAGNPRVYMQLIEALGPHLPADLREGTTCVAPTPA